MNRDLKEIIIFAVLLIGVLVIATVVSQYILAQILEPALFIQVSRV